MRSSDISKFSSRPLIKLTAIALSVAFLTTPVSATPEEAKKDAQMMGLPFKKSETTFRPLPDGSTVVRGRIHGGKGFDTEVTVPRMSIGVKIDSPQKTTNGHSDTFLDRKMREARHKAIYQILKEKGYSYEEEMRKFKESGKKTQPEIWKEQTEATRKEIEKNGAITSKNFIVPGSTPEQSARLTEKHVGVRRENGKLVYYAFVPNSNGEGGYYERIDLRGAKKAASESVSSKPVTKEKTKLTKSQKGEASKNKDSPEQQTAIPVDPAGSETVTEQKVLRISPSKIPVTEEDMPTMDDMMKKLKEHFPDAVPTSRVQVPGYLERGLIFALGISEAHAQDTHQEPEQKITLGISPQAMNAEYMAEARKLHENTKAITEQARKVFSKSESETELEEVTGTTSLDAINFASEIVKSSNVARGNENVQKEANEVAQLGKQTGLKGFFDRMAELWNSKSEIRNRFQDGQAQLDALRKKHAASPGEENAISQSDSQHTYIFVSYSLSDEILLDILERNHGRTDVTVVMRGIPTTSEAAGGTEGDKPANILEGAMRIQNLTRKFAEEIKDDSVRAAKPAVEIIIDPPLFREYQISVVPSVAVVGKLPAAVERTSANDKRAFAKLQGKVAGITNDVWLKEQLDIDKENGKTEVLDLGIRGETFEILEPDLIEEMKRRASLIDWEAKKEGAIKRFWSKQQFTVLPTAKRTTIREFEPVIIVEQDIRDLAGNIIRRKGETLNLLEMKPFTKTMIIFNPTSEEEMERVEALLASSQFSDPIFVATKINSNTEKKGWDFYENLSERLNAHVYTLTPEIRDTWGVEQTPTVITADNTRHVFYVQEIGEDEEGQK